MSAERPAHCLITSVELQKKNRHRYNIFLDHEYAFSVHEDVMIKHRLLKGEMIETDQIEQILKDDEYQQALHQALRFIGRKPRSEKEVRSKLKEKGYESDIADDVLHRLKKQKYIDDEQFAVQWTEHRIFSQKKGRKWVKHELNQKGVSKGHISQALEQIDEDDELQSALDIARKKWSISSGTLLERKRKTASFLLRRGYSNSIVSKVVNLLSSSSQAEDEEEFPEDDSTFF